MSDQKPNATAPPGGVQAREMADASQRTAVDAIITINEKGIIESVNPAAAVLFGYDIGELQGRNISVLTPEPHRSVHDIYLSNYLETGVKKIVGIGRDVQGQHNDGHLFPIHLSVNEFYADGRRFFTGIIHDLTARKEVEEELRRQQALFQSIFNHVPDAMVLTDQRAVISLCNPALTKIFGYAPGEVIGKSMRLLHETEDAFLSHCELMTDAQEGANAEPEIFTFRHKNGRMFPAELVCSPVRDSEGLLLGFLGLMRDVSEEQLREKSLRQSQRMEAVGQLTGGIAHDFNNLLTVITGNHELLEMRLSDDKNRDLLRRANEAAQMGARLIDRLLAFSRRRQLESEIIDLNEIVLRTLEVLRRTLGADIELVSSLASDLWQTKADASEVESAVLNLAINARDAMSDRGPAQGCLKIGSKNATIGRNQRDVTAGLAPGDYVQLSVSDNGRGMDADVLGHVFEPFFTTKETGRGTGLGLSTIYGFAQQSGGNVTIASAPGEGATVDLYLPRFDAAEQDLQAKPAPAAVAPVTQGRILVVEDNSEVRELTLERLQQLGYDVIAAENGVDALQLLGAETDLDLVFSDVVMPGGVSGIDVAKWVRDNRPGLKVLLTSGFAGELARGQSECGDGQQVLRKPYDRAQLSEAISACLAGN